MTELWSAIYLVMVALTATNLTKRAFPIVSGHPVYLTQGLTWVTLFFTLFFGSFFILGLIELAVGEAIVSTAAAIVAGSGCAVAILLWARRWPVVQPLLPGTVPLASKHRLIYSCLPGTGLTRIMVGVTLSVYLALAIMLGFGFPQGFEAQAYHLPIAVHIFDSGSLKAWSDAFMHTYPANMSLYTGFFLNLLPERLVSVLNLPFLSLLLCATYALSRVAGADRNASLLAALGLATIPIIAFSSLELGSDVAGAAFFAVAAYFVFAKPSTHLSWPVLAGLAAGIAFGFKSLHLISATFLIILIIIEMGLKTRKAPSRARVRQVFTPLLSFVTAFLITSGYWLVRNYIQFDNPLYPVYFSGVFDILGWAKAPDVDFTQRNMTQLEWVRTPLEWLVYPWVEWHYLQDNFKHSSGLGAFFAAAVPGALLIGLVDLIRTTGCLTSGRELSKEQIITLSLFSGTVFVLAIWWVIGDRQPRYFMGSLVFMSPLIARAIHQTYGNARKALEHILIVCMVVMLFIVFSKQFAEFGLRFVLWNQFSRAEHYGYPAMVDNLPPGAVILNATARTWNYPLHGTWPTNQVIGKIATGRELATKSISCDDCDYYIQASQVQKLGATHIFVVGDKTFGLDDCVSLLEIDRIDRNPGNGELLSEARILYAITLNDCRNLNH